ncbi:hypothetical protein GCM10009548_02190 [Streptomyces malaysiensis subsp. malaysiensis]|uniref:Uncharacterized protein n=1 Tax=Streptomyces malaysiensis TaxID=92644 RepID=A0ABX6W5M9_STRMQ|nr:MULTISPECIES: hypothetical protein [Streptomyces]QPI56318.1 hypothetical protein I1A49_16455 [Streptomyces solisilvae]UHH17803.1 hypothetical protein LUV23_16570 [Streptomyces sp. HNM0561]
MRAYHNPRREAMPWKIVMTTDEAAELLEDLTCVDLERFPVMGKVARILGRVFNEWEESQ